MMNEYIVVNNGGFLCTNSFRALTWLNASQIMRDGVRLMLSKRMQNKLIEKHYTKYCDCVSGSAPISYSLRGEGLHVIA